MEIVYGCTILRDRQEIGREMNFRKHPVLWMEIGKSPAGWDGQIYEGCKATILGQSTRYGALPYTGDLQMYSDEQDPEVVSMPQFWNHIHLKDWGACLKADFGYSDVIEHLEDAMSPLLEPNQEVIVIFKDSERRRCWVRKMVTSKRFDPHCATMMTLENPEVKK